MASRTAAGLAPLATPRAARLARMHLDAKPDVEQLLRIAQT